MSQAIDLEKLNNIRIAASFDANRTYPYLFQQLGYRRHVAEQMLRSVDENEHHELSELYEYVNNSIKKTIGLE